MANTERTAERFARIYPEAYDRLTRGFALQDAAYCGLVERTDPHTVAGIRRHVARVLRRRRELGFPVAVLAAGREYEIGDPEDAVLVSDLSGLLSVTVVEYRSAKCFECGDRVPVGEACGCSSWEDSTDENEN